MVLITYTNGKGGVNVIAPILTVVFLFVFVLLTRPLGEGEEGGGGGVSVLLERTVKPKFETNKVMRIPYWVLFTKIRFGIFYKLQFGKDFL